MHRRTVLLLLTLTSAISIVAIASCVGDEPERNPVVTPTTEDASSSSNDSSSPLSDSGGSGSDTAPAVDTSNIPFDCPTQNVFFCETWETNPLYDGWTKDEGGGIIATTPSTRYVGRALSLSLANTNSGTSKARLVRDRTLTTTETDITLRFDARVVTRTSNDPPLQIGAFILGTAGVGSVFEALYTDGSLVLQYTTDAPPIFATTAALPFTKNDWHTVSIKVHRADPQSTSFQVDGVVSSKATNVKTDGVDLRVFAGLKTQPNTAITVVEHDNVILLSE